MTSFPLVGTVTGAARAVYSYSQAEQISSFFSFVRLEGAGIPPKMFNRSSKEIQ